MLNSARRRRNSRRSGCGRNRRRSLRGGAGMAYNILGGPVTGSHVINNYDGKVVASPSCDGAVRPGFITGAPIQGGLPGFRGGRRSLHGGAYTNTAMSVPGTTGALMERAYSGCGAGQYAVQNSLNRGDFPQSVLTAPAPQVAYPTPMKGGAASYAADAMVYEAPRAGYTTAPSNSSGGNAGTLADGKTPFLVNVPYSSQPTASGACVKTGGGGKKSRKNRKNRKSRKASRKNRKSRNSRRN